MEFAKDRKCDECEKEVRLVLYCANCIEFLCESCDGKIHNKGTRVSHLRFVHVNDFYHEKCSTKFLITFFSVQVIRAEGETLQESMRAFIQEQLLQEASVGILHVDVEKLVPLLAAEYKISTQKALCWLEKQSEVGTWNINVRSFETNAESRLVTMNLKHISVQAIIWIILSIKNDCMQPTETLVHSRFKECFNIKIGIKDWKVFVEEVASNQKLAKKMNRYKDLLGEIEVQTSVEGSVLFTLKNESWPYEDLIKPSPSSLEYTDFLSFISEYLSDTPLKPNDDFYTSCDRQAGLSRCNQGLMKKKSCSSANSFYSELNAGKESTEKRSVRGGKYGCAIMVKHCGSNFLKSLSVGHIIALISLALQQQVIIHHKTLIIKNTQKKEQSCSLRDETIKKVQDVVIEILTENNKRGVTLAQLPFFLSRKLGKTFNFEELGFPKLKNFLVTLEEKILLEKSHNNHIKLYLRGYEPADPSKQYFEPQELSGELRDRTASEKLNDVEYSSIVEKKQGSLKPNPFEVKTKKINQIDHTDHKKSYSTYQQYFQSVEAELVSILNRYRCGIELTRLEKLLTTYKYNSSFARDKKEEFQDFLINNFDQYLQIIVSGKNSQGKYVLMAYPRSFGLTYTNSQRFNEYGFAQNFEESRHRTYHHPMSDTSFSSSHKAGSQNKDSFFKGFEYQIISPIPSPSTTNLYNDGNSDSGPDYDEDPISDSSSFKNIRKLILEENN